MSNMIEKSYNNQELGIKLTTSIFNNICNP